MKALTLLFLIISVTSFSQKDDSTHNVATTAGIVKTKPKVDSAAAMQQQINATVQAINYVIGDMKASLYGQVSADDYALLVKIQEIYIKIKNEQLNPVPKPKK